MTQQIEDAISDYIHYIRIERGLSENTITSYRQDLNQFGMYLSQEHLEKLIISLFCRG